MPATITLEELRAIALKVSEDAQGHYRDDIKHAETFKDLIQAVWSAGDDSGARDALCDY